MIKAKLSLTFLFLITLAGSLLAAVAGPPYGTGVVTANNTTTRLYLMGDPAIFVDNAIAVSYNMSVASSKILNMTTDISKFTGSIYIVDTAPAGTNNINDLMDITPTTSITVSRSRSPANSITTNVMILTCTTCTYPKIQATLRTLKFAVKNGQNGADTTRNISIWFIPAGYTMIFEGAPRVGRIYAIVTDIITSSTTAPSSWLGCYNDARLQPTRFGLHPYFASITSSTEEINMPTNGNAGGIWIGARTVDPAHQIPFDPTAASQPSGTSPWFWSDGPEKGIKFWDGGPRTQGGLPQNNMYSGWRVSPGPEPNGSTTAIKENNSSPAAPNSQNWNDNDAAQTTAGNTTDVTSYYLEYGGMPNDTISYSILVSSGNSLMVGMPF